MSRLPPEERVVLEDPATPAPGADAFRWFFYASSPPWSATRHSLSNVRALQKDFAVKLRNVYSFFTIYGNIDGFDPNDAPPAGPDDVELDRWIASELALTVRAVADRMDAYDCYGATQKLVSFVDALSNWYVRRSRKRFWRSGLDADKQRAYATLHRCLVTVAKLTAPFTPYGAEAMYQNLVVRPGLPGARESVHLEDYPVADERAVDAALSSKIATVRALASLGLQVRNQAKIKVRQPLGAAHVIVSKPSELDTAALEMIKDELNVLSVAVYGSQEATRFVEHRVKPNFRSLGERGLGKEAQILKKTMAALSSEEAAALVAKLPASLDGVALDPVDVEVEFAAREGFAAAGYRAIVVVLDTRLDDELRDLGLVRELLNRVQAMRKEANLEYADRIQLWVHGGDRLRRVVEQHSATLCSEVLEVTVSTDAAPPSTQPKAMEVEGETVAIGMVRVSAA